jgi:hypothetical protein
MLANILKAIGIPKIRGPSSPSQGGAYFGNTPLLGHYPIGNFKLWTKHMELGPNPRTPISIGRSRWPHTGRSGIGPRPWLTFWATSWAIWCCTL